MQRNVLYYLLVICIPFKGYIEGSLSEDREENMADLFIQRRVEMVEKHLLARGIKDLRVLESMNSVPRHHFVPVSFKKHAYDDTPLPIGYHQTISQPYIVALMLQAAKLKPIDIVLEIGTGSGYAAVVLSKLVKEVYSIELIPELAVDAREKF